MNLAFLSFLPSDIAFSSSLGLRHGLVSVLLLLHELGEPLRGAARLAHVDVVQVDDVGVVAAAHPGADEPLLPAADPAHDGGGRAQADAVGAVAAGGRRGVAGGGGRQGGHGGARVAPESMIELLNVERVKM